MRFTICYLMVLCLAILSACSNKPGLNPVDYVDPLIGTDAQGHTFPGATTPFGMVQLSPSNDFKSWDWCSGYHYSDSILKGFAHTHVSGAGLAGLGDFLFMPTAGEVRVNPGTEENPDEGYRSRFSHRREVAKAGYYSVWLDDYNIGVELTSTPRVGFHRYSFEKGGMVNVIIDPTHQIMEKVLNAGIEIVSEKEVRGFKTSRGEAGERTAYFHAEFSKPFGDFGVSKADSVFQQTKNSSGENTKAYVRFNTNPGESIEVKVAVSFVSYEGAKRNLVAEARNKDFNQVHQEAVKMWEEKLGKIQIEGTSVEQKRIFYTGMYHSFISPNLISDVDGKYIVEGKEYQSSFPQYSNFSTWDTYRALNPLFTIIEQEKTSEFVNSLVSRHTDSKVGLPVWELLGHDNVCMIGYNTVSPLADAVLKDIKGIDAQKVYQAIKAASNSTEKHSPNYDRNGMEEYLLFNYVPGEINSSVSKTVEQNYYDWCISRVADKLGYTDEAEYYRKRSLGYRNLFHHESGFLFPKYSTGEWRKMDLNVWDDLKGNYVSGNIWGYSSYVPHDINGLKQLVERNQVFSEWLDNIFADTTSIEGTTHVDISGFIGKYGHGDEPSQHMAYLYNYTGEPWKTQELVRRIMDEFYSDRPDGLINNEDLGQMSAWYIFSALGFYPVCPGDLKYIIGIPKYDKTVVNLENGNTFTVMAKNNKPGNKYIQSVTLNGEPHNQSFITHKQILDGGELVFVLGNTPNKNWGTGKNDIPFSAVKVDKNNRINNPSVTYKPYDPDPGIVFEGTHKIILTCNTPGARIHYTLNGEIPTEKSKEYRKAIEITKTTELKAIAFSDSLKPSLVFEKEYLAGRSFKDLPGYPKFQLETKAEKYGAPDGSLLMDQEIGTNHFADGKWTGWSGSDMVATIDFGKKTSFKNISVGYLTNTGVWIFPPKFIFVLISDDNTKFRKIAELKTIQPQAPSTSITISRQILNLNNAKGRYLKVEARNMGKIPEWHGAAGLEPWMFIDEILIN